MSCTHTIDVGAYLFGSLDLRERSAFERHLSGCDTCRAEMLRLAPLPGLLGRLTLDTVENLHELPTIPPKPRRRPWRRMFLLGAAMLVVVVTTGVLLLRPSPPPTWEATDAGTGVAGSAAMVTQSWGTEVRLKLAGVPAGKRCALVVYDKDGNKEIGGWWGTPEAGDEVVPGSTSFPLDRIDRMDVIADKSVLVTLRP